MRGLLLLLCGVMGRASSLDVLVYNVAFSHSHSRQTGLVADLLADAGHSVVSADRPFLSLQTELAPVVAPAEFRRRSTRVAQTLVVQPHRELQRMLDEDDAADRMHRAMWVSDASPVAMLEVGPSSARHRLQLFANLTRYLSLQCEQTLASPQFASLRTRKFDLAFAEIFDFCAFGLFKMLGIETFAAYSTSVILDHQAVLLGIPRAPSYVPASMGNANAEMSIFERALNTFAAELGSTLFLRIADAQTAVFRKVVDANFEDLRSVTSQAALLFTNSVPILDFPHPTLNKVVDLGGLGITTPKPVDEEWQKILSQKPRTVLVSFGSIAKSMHMSDAQKHEIIEMARNTPDVQFIWKYEADDLSDLPNNLHLSKWTPQSDLLDTGKIDLFITHGGLGSTVELAFSGVPAITIPLMGDQPRNAQMLKRHGCSEMFSKFDIARPAKLKQLVDRMLDDSKYKQSAARLATILHNVPFKPRELLLRHVEFVGRFGSLPQLDPHGRRLGFAAYFLLDIALALAVALLALAGAAVLICRRLLLAFTKLKTE